MTLKSKKIKNTSKKITDAVNAAIKRSEARKKSGLYFEQAPSSNPEDEKILDKLWAEYKKPI